MASASPKNALGEKHVDSAAVRSRNNVRIRRRQEKKGVNIHLHRLMRFLVHLS